MLEHKRVNKSPGLKGYNPRKVRETCEEVARDLMLVSSLTTDEVPED